MNTPGRKVDRDDEPARGTESAAPTPPAPRSPGGAGNSDGPGAKSRDWIYGELGLTRDGSGAGPASKPATAPAVPPLDFDALRRDDPDESPFPPGSLGGGIADPEPRVFHGFPKPGTGAGLSAADSPSATVPRPGSGPARPPEHLPASQENPFRVYDERSSAITDKPRPTPYAAAAPIPATPPTPAEVSAALASTAERLTADSLTAAKVLHRRRRVPGRGWRKGLLAATGGVVNLGPSTRDRHDVALEARVRAPITNCHHVAVISLKGGVGKTTTAAALGSMFAWIRADRVIAVDANPDRGTLGDKIAIDRSNATVRDFVRRSAQLDRYSAVREFTAQAESRLEVLSSESDPLSSMAFSEHDYRVIVDVLERYYNLVLTDCGTGLLHSAMVGVLAKADQVVIVSTASLDGARSASATLDWLEAHNYGRLARDSVTVITSVRPKASTVDLDEIVDHFARRTRSVVAVPYDEHLAEGGQIDLRMLNRGSYHAHLQLAAEVADGFGSSI